ncbi:hypothetical protein M1523_01845 [Patescibacteria group bacterium]|nr:hypothetical protein [Patescibacteria group bacterium]
MVNPTDFTPASISYRLGPSDQLGQPINITYPTVEVFPNHSLKYQLVQLIETNDLRTNNQTPLFFADKRVAELMRWGKNLDYTGWEDVVNRYYNLMVRAIDYATDDELTTVQSHFLTHQDQIDQTIEQSEKNAEEKVVLRNLIDSVMTSINHRIERNAPPPDPNRINYQLTGLANDREFGRYDVLVDFSQLPDSYRTSLSLAVGDRIFKPTDFISSDRLLVFSGISINDRVKTIALLVSPFPLTEPSDGWQNQMTETAPVYQYRLGIKPFPFPGDYYWQFSGRINQPAQLRLEEKYATREAITNPHSSETTDYVPTLKTDHLIDYQLYPHQLSVIIRNQFHIDPLPEQPLTNSVIVATKKPMSQENVRSLSFTIAQFLNPTVYLEKTGRLPGQDPMTQLTALPGHNYQLIFKQTTTAQQQYVLDALGFGWRPQLTVIASATTSFVKLRFWPRQVLWFVLWFLLTGLGIYSLWFYLKCRHPQQTNWIGRLCFRRSTTTVIKILAVPLKLVWRLIKFTSKKQRFLWLTIAVSGIVFDIFLFRSRSNWLLNVVFLSWILTVIGYQFEARLSFITALFYLSLCLLLLLLKADFMAEKAAVWGYLMLVAAVIQTLIALKRPPPPHYAFRRFAAMILPARFKKMLKRTVAFILLNASHLRQTLQRCFRKMIRLVFNPYPKTVEDYSANVIKGLLLGAIIITAGYYGHQQLRLFYQRYQQQIAAENRRKLWNSLVPIIDKTEPYLIYRGMKVVIYGHNFGWQEKPLITIVKEDGETILPDEITESMVVFTIPLTWDYGEMNFWIEKPISWDNQNITAKTKTARIRIIPVTPDFNKDDEAFFQQLPHLKPETRQRNGYE